MGKPGSAADHDKAIGLIFCPSCCGSQEQLQWQGSIHAAIPLLRSPSRSIINDTEKQERSSRAGCPAHAGATRGAGGWEGREGKARQQRGEKDKLLAPLIHQLGLKGARGGTEYEQRTIAWTHMLLWRHTDLISVSWDEIMLTHIILTNINRLCDTHMPSRHWTSYDGCTKVWNPNPLNPLNPLNAFESFEILLNTGAFKCWI